MKPDCHYAQDRRQPSVIGKEVHPFGRDPWIQDELIAPRIDPEVSANKAVLVEIGHVCDKPIVIVCRCVMRQVVGDTGTRISLGKLGEQFQLDGAVKVHGDATLEEKVGVGIADAMTGCNPGLNIGTKERPEAEDDAQPETGGDIADGS